MYHNVVILSLMNYYCIVHDFYALYNKVLIFWMNVQLEVGVFLQTIFISHI